MRELSCISPMEESGVDSRPTFFTICESAPVKSREYSDGFLLETPGTTAWYSRGHTVVW